MIKCQKCGNSNDSASHFCRFCGDKFFVAQPQQQDPYDHPAPRPYAWKTDEFQTQNEARRTYPMDAQHQQTRPLGQHNASAISVPLSYQQSPNHQMMPVSGYAVDANYHCPRCGSSYLPVIERRISTAGWIVFSALLVFTIIFFWIGLLLKEDAAICPVCRSRVN